MKRFLLAASALLSITACNFQPSGYTADDIVLYGIKERHTVFYGKLEPGQTKNLTLGPLQLSLSPEQPLGPLAVPGALSVNGLPTLQTDTAEMREVFALATIPASSELGVLTRDPLEAVYYFNGSRWFDIGSSAKFAANVKLRLPIRERLGLRGVGLLTDAEADALAAYLQTKYKNQPLGLALIDNAHHADSPLGLQPPPDRNNITALYVQVGVPVDLLGGFASPEPLRLTPLLTGANSNFAESRVAVRLDKDSSAFAVTWALIAGNQIPTPPRPEVDFSRSSVVTVFQGRKPSGGYGLAIEGARLEGSTLVLNVTFGEPRPGTAVAQSLTSPFICVVVTGGGKFDRVRIVNSVSGAPVIP